MLQIHNEVLRRMEIAITLSGDWIFISELLMRLLTKIVTLPLARRYVWRFLKNPLYPFMGKVVLGFKLVSWKYRAIGSM